MNPTPHDNGIPLLTEIITSSDEPELEVVTAEPLTGQPDDMIRDEPARAIETLRSAAPDDHDWERMERELRERILSKLRLELDAIITERIQESLNDMLQVAVESITSELRLGLHQVLSDVVSDTVAAQMPILKKDF